MERIPWDDLAGKLGYKDQTTMWEKYYLADKLSIAQLSRKTGTSPNAIRSALVACNIKLRSRGGPHPTLHPLTQEQLDLIVQGKWREVAKDLDTSYGALYRRFYKATGVSIGQARRERLALNLGEPGESLSS